MQSECSPNELRRLAGGLDVSPLADWLHRTLERRLLLALRHAEAGGNGGPLVEKARKRSDVSLPNG